MRFFYFAVILSSLHGMNASFSRAGHLAPLNKTSDSFPSVEQFRDVATVVGSLGLRTPGSPRHNALVDYLTAQLSYLDKILEVKIHDFPIRKWQTLDDSTLSQAASISILDHDDTSRAVSLIGAIPWTKPTNSDTIAAPLVYVPSSTNLLDADVAGKIVLRDFGPTADVPFSQLFSLGYYRSGDLNHLSQISYNRPYTGSPHQDLINAGLAGAAGFISLFNASEKDVASYYDPHEGTHYLVPGVYAGVESAEVLKEAASKAAYVELSVRAHVAQGAQRQINARLQGTSNETIYVVCHTDGNTFVQDNGVSALLNLARYFSAIPLKKRKKTIEFVFTTGHLSYASDTTVSLAEHLDRTYDTDDTVLVVALEHMGTREILPAGSPSGAANGQRLELTGESEVMLWCVGPSETLQNVSIATAQSSRLDRIIVARGAGAPVRNMVPEYPSFGGIGTFFHQRLLPTIALVSGPWSLWAPKFGAAAVDFERLRNQTRAFADVITALQPLSKVEIAGEYLTYRRQRASGKASAVDPAPPVFAPAHSPKAA